MIVHTRKPLVRASQCFATRKRAEKFAERLSREAHVIPRTQYGSEHRWAVNYFGAGKGSQRARTKPEASLRTLYNEDGTVKAKLLKVRSGRNVVRIMCDENGNVIA